MITWATEINLRARRKAGQMLAVMAKEKKRHSGKGNNKSRKLGLHVATPTLADIGIEKTQSSRWQQLAAIPEEQFEKDVAVASELASETIDKASKKNHREKKREEIIADEILESSRWQ